MRQRSAHATGSYPESHAADDAYPAAYSGHAPHYDQGGAGHAHPGGGQWDDRAAQTGRDPAYGAHDPAYPGYDRQAVPQGFSEAAPGHGQDGYAAENVGWAPSAEHANPALSDPAYQGGHFQGGHFGEPQVGFPPQSATNASLDDYRPDAGPAAEPQFGAPPPLFGGAGRDDERYQQAGHGEADEELYDDEYEYDYEDEDDEEGRGYGWKMVAGIVAVGVVVAGGGFVLYDTLAGGGAGGPAPIIKADRGPAKTAPAEPGGRSFANQDSKLLGRLDSGNGTTKRTALDDDGRKRVREVPTVRVGPDGRLIMPKPSQSDASNGGRETAAAPSVPGINIVDNLSGSRSGLGGQGLPAIIPKAAEPQGQPVPRTAVATPVREPVSSPAAPIIRNGAGASPSGNLATARSAVPPPVPQKSAISSAWRMTGTSAPARSRQTAAAPQPARATTAATTTTASTLGAANVARQASRQYVAVIATKASRMAALQSFAELQQRHPATLSNRVPSVQKADLSARGLGTMYRLLVGPAGSRKAANEVCASLKASGYSGCWVKAN